VGSERGVLSGSELEYLKGRKHVRSLGANNRTISDLILEI
jgi:hypothetical protein